MGHLYFSFCLSPYQIACGPTWVKNNEKPMIWLSSCLCLNTINIPKPEKTWPWHETQFFSLPLVWKPQTHTHFLSRNNHLIFKPHIALGKGKEDFWKCPTFRIEFWLMASDIPLFVSTFLSSTMGALFIPNTIN